MSTTTVYFSNVQDGWTGPGTGNIDADPFFVDAAEGDLRLSSDASPCVDTGANFPELPATDLAGNPRIVDGDRNGTATVDMGAYEFQCWQIHNITQDNWYETIQCAINDANNGDEIEVSPGTYHEAIDFGGNAVRLYSTAGPNDTTIDGSGHYHVVQCISNEGPNTILEGFTITGGNANGSVYTDRVGGGMYNVSSSPTVTNCIFIGNTASNYGGGMHNDSSSPTVTNCTFSGNSATRSGGGMYNSSSSPMVTKCTFSGNSATSSGGGMYNLGSSPTVTNSTFSGNSANTNGGGMVNADGSDPNVTSCTFNGNSAVYFGGGMHNDNGSSPTVTNCTFTGNTASSNTWGGGGMFNHTSSNPIMTNCTFTGNTATTDGGGIYNNNHSSLSVTNCILWGNTPDEIFNDSTSSSTITYSDVQGGQPGLGNIDADPCFVDVNNPDPNMCNLRLSHDSPCIDAGDTIAVPGGIWADLDGNLRVSDNPEIPDTGISMLGATVDMGAYEFQPCLIAGDINCDGVVDFKDVAILCGNWLAGK
jgi:predicted outer membrane repeat protein/parallel beta-helix repeat protein